MLLREIQEQGYCGGLTQLSAYWFGLKPNLPVEPVVRFETQPGEQMQVDWVEFHKGKDPLYAFCATLGFSRVSFVVFVTNMTVDTLIECHEKAFAAFGGVPKKALYDKLKAVITFLEGEIILAADIAAALQLPGLDKAAVVSRDKYKQRTLLESQRIPAPRYWHVTDVNQDWSRFDEFYPVIVKPTQASLSYGVYLVRSRQELQHRLQEIYTFSQRNRLHFHESNDHAFALVEEFLPGDEITLDGVMLDGKFILGGIHNKWRNMGPTFEEDLYSLPFKKPEFTVQLTEMAAAICRALCVTNAMFNVEMRQDAQGNFKVLEFSIRPSGGYCYRHIKAVYGIDIVKLYTKQLLNLPIEVCEMTPRSPVLTTCTKWAFGIGTIVKNSAGAARDVAGYDDYYPLAKAGDTLRGLPHDIGCVGRLSLHAPFHSLNDVLDLERRAYQVINQLEIDWADTVIAR